MNLENKIFKNNVGLEFKVLNKTRRKNTETYYNIQFLVSGSIKEAERRNIIKGSIRDDYDKHIYGVACTGNVHTTKPEFNKITFKRWYSMIERCYNPKSVGYKSYGAKGVVVCERWLCFENYYYDIQNIEGFEYEKYMNGDIQLDKDIKEFGNKQYCGEKCVFVSRFKNESNKPTEMKKFIAISPRGEKYEFMNQTECARKFNLTARSIGKVLNGQLNHHKNWKFIYK